MLRFRTCALLFVFITAKPVDCVVFSCIETQTTSPSVKTEKACMTQPAVVPDFVSLDSVLKLQSMVSSRSLIASCVRIGAHYLSGHFVLNRMVQRSKVLSSLSETVVGPESKPRGLLRLLWDDSPQGVIRTACRCKASQAKGMGCCRRARRHQRELRMAGRSGLHVRTALLKY